MRRGLGLVIAGCLVAGCGDGDTATVAAPTGPTGPSGTPVAALTPPPAPPEAATGPSGPTAAPVATPAPRRKRAARVKPPPKPPPVAAPAPTSAPEEVEAVPKATGKPRTEAERKRAFATDLTAIGHLLGLQEAIVAQLDQVSADDSVRQAGRALRRAAARARHFDAPADAAADARELADALTAFAGAFDSARKRLAGASAATLRAELPRIETHPDGRRIMDAVTKLRQRGYGDR